jgi:hypothetical protein
VTPARSSAHLAFIRSLPCAILGCRSRRRVEAAHTPGSRGMAQKRSDLETIPLCVQHHDEQHRIGWKRFIESYQLDIAELLKALQEKPRIWVASNRALEMMFYYASFRQSQFLLCLTSRPLKDAWTIARERCREHLIDEVFTERRKHEIPAGALRLGSSDRLG